MDAKVWNDQYDAVIARILNEKSALVALIRDKANEILSGEDKDNFIGLNGSEWALGLDIEGKDIVAYGDGYWQDLIDLTIYELREIGDCLYINSYELI